ncbi:MAG: lipopolysaccharide biosynthesis protein [Candidatus Gastranaerophilales bacterium]|nr:lipopolysaccharide biosynthesis protein [Candidatus Gastranaerophilales bacterium]
MNILDVKKVGDKTRQAVKWSISLQVVQKIFIFATSILLARLLTPADFGLLAMAMTLDTITWVILSMGVLSAVTHFQDNVEERINAAFWLILSSSSCLVLLQIIFAPVAANFYNEPMLVPIIRVSAIGLLIASFGAVQRTILAKNIEFKKISILETFTNILKNILYIVFALAGFKVWSFIYPKVIIAAISAISLWNITKWRPQFKFYFKYWGEMLGFGKNVLFSNIIDYIVNNSSYILIGNLLGSSMLGIYSFAYDKSMFMINSISSPVTAISFPTFARLQNHKDKLKNAYFKAIKAISLVTFPYVFGQLVLGPEFIIGIFGNKWQSSIIIFQMILIFTLLRSASQCINPLLQAIGKPNMALKWNLIYAPVYICSIYVGFKLDGIYGIAAITTLVGVIGAIIYMGLVIRVLNWSFNDVYEALKPALSSSILMGIIIGVLKFIIKLYNAPDLFILASLILAGALVYVLSIQIFFKETYEFIIENIVKITGIKKVEQNLTNKG